MRLACLAFAAALTACGTIPNATGDDDGSNDGGLNDGGGNGPDATAVGEATARAIVHNMPAPGTMVIFQDASGQVTETVMADGEGLARSTVTRGSMITALFPNDGAGQRIIVTVTDVNPGDTLDIGTRDTPHDEGTLGSVFVTTSGDYPGASFYTFDPGGRCNQGSGSPPFFGTNVELQKDCVGASNQYTMLAKAYDGSGNPIAFTYAESVFGGTGSTLSLPPWRNDWGNIRVQATNAPPATLGIGVDGEVTQLGKTFSLEGASRALSPGAGATLQALYPGGFGEAFAVSTFVSFTDGVDSMGNPIDGGAAVLFQRFGATPPGTVPYDLSTLLPRVHMVKMEREDSRPQMSWVEEGDEKGAGADGKVATIRWTDSSGFQPIDYRWMMILRPEAEAFITYPEMPADGWPPPGANAYDAPEIFVLDFDTLEDNWAGFRDIATAVAGEDGPPVEFMFIRAAFANGF